MEFLPSPGLAIQPSPTGEIRIGFFSAPKTLGVLSQRQPLGALRFPSLTVPHLIGALVTDGGLAFRHYDLDPVFDGFMRRNAGSIDLSLLEGEAFRRFMGPGDASVGCIVGRLLGAAQVTPADLFAVSLSMPDMAREEGPRIRNLALCLVRELKRRHPGCRTVIGGLSLRSREAVRDHSRFMLEACPDLDFVVEGPGEAPLRDILREIRANGAEGGTSAAGLRVGNGRILGDSAVAPEEAPPGEEARAPRRSRHGAPLPITLPVFQTAESGRVTGVYLADHYRWDDGTRAMLGGGLGRDILPLTLRFTDGCANGCAFCSQSRRLLRAAPVGDVVRSLARLVETHDARCFIFMNSCLNWSYDYALSFARELVDARLGILWTDSIELAGLDGRLVSALRESGFCRADVGVETASDRLLRRYGKPGRRQGMLGALRLLHQHGIWNYLNLIVGLPGEDEDDVRETLGFLEDSAPFANGYAINRFWVHEGSRLHVNPAKFGVRLLGPAIATPDGARLPYATVDRSWDAAQAWSRATEARVVDHLARLQGYDALADGNVPYHLLFFLYSTLGHDAKDRIDRIFRQSLGYPARPERGPLASLVRRLEAGPVPLGDPRLFVAGATAMDDGSLRIHVRVGRRSVPLGIAVTGAGPAAVRGERLSVFFFSGEADGTASMEAVARMVCAALEAELDR